MNHRLHTIIVFILLFLINSIAMAGKTPCQSSCCNKQTETAGCCSKTLANHHSFKSTSQPATDSSCPSPATCLTRDQAHQQFLPAINQPLLADLGHPPAPAYYYPPTEKEAISPIRPFPPPLIAEPPLYTLHCSLLN